MRPRQCNTRTTSGSTYLQRTCPRSYETPNIVDTASADKNDLKDYWVFIGFRGLDWRGARVEDVGEVVSWLALPPAGVFPPPPAPPHPTFRPNALESPPARPAVCYISYAP